MPKKMGARAKLRAYFLANIGKVLNSNELSEVAGGITEWARRVRELRNEEGYKILTHNDRSCLKPGQYLLEDSKPEPAFERAVSKETRAFVLDRKRFYLSNVWCRSGRSTPLRFDQKNKVALRTYCR